MQQKPLQNLKKLFLHITLFFIFSFSLFSQQENENIAPVIQQEEKIENLDSQKVNLKIDSTAIDSQNLDLNIPNDSTAIDSQKVDTNVDENTIKPEVEKEEVLFRDPIFGIDYTNKDLGNITDFDIINDKDTLLYTRSYGDWWYGASWLMTNNTFYLGNFNFAKISYLPVDANNPRVEYANNQTNSMYNISLMAEWSPVRQVWGVGGFLRYERLYINSDYEPTDAANRNFIFNTNVDFSYLTLSPFFKYKTPLEGLNLMVLMDMSYILSYDSYFFRQQKSGPANIKNELVIDFKDDIRFKFGVNFGIEYEYLLQDIQKIEFFNKLNLFKNTRVKIAPMAMIGINTSPISNNGGSYPVTFRAGLSLKLGPDNIKSDTIPFNPTPRFEYLAKFEPKIKVQFAGFLERESFVASDVAFFEVAQVNNQVSEEPKLPSQSLRDKEDSKIATQLKEEEKPKIEFKKGFNKTYTYNSSESVNPSKDLRDFLNELADYLKSSPTAEIRVVGHSDNVGTGQEIQERSIKRAQMVQSYLVAKGINARRVLVTGLGAREPVGDISSASGRAKNRRVVIQVIK